MSVSVCIPSAGPPLGLWATISACEAVRGDAELNYIATVSGRDWGERESLLREWGVGIIHSTEPLIPPVARNHAANCAKGDILVFFDDHCIPTAGFFGRVEQDFADPNVHLLHGSYLTGPGSPYHYFHFYGIKSMVEGDYRRQPHSANIHRVGSASHAFFAIRRTVWESVGGYSDYYQGFGGEEASFDLKVWAAGYQVWLDPKLVYYHYSARESERGYEKRIEPKNYESALRELAPHLDRLKAKFAVEEIPC